LKVQASRRKSRRKLVLPDQVMKGSATNAIELLPHVKMNSIWGKMWVERQAQLASDRGGLPQCSEGQRMILKHCATLDVELTLMAEKLATLDPPGGSEQALKTFQTVFNALRRGIEDLGLTRS
jgi:hypothetical protein